MTRSPQVTVSARAALFLAVGLLFFFRWRQVGSVDYQDPETLNDWLAVVGFSVALVCLAVALPLFSELTGDKSVVRTSLVPAVGCALGGIINFLEDGLQWSWMFWGFVASTGITTLGLLVLTIVTAWRSRGVARLLALVPATTLAAVLLFELVGGLFMLAAWTGAAILAVRMPRPATVRPVSP